PVRLPGTHNTRRLSSCVGSTSTPELTVKCRQWGICMALVYDSYWQRTHSYWQGTLAKTVGERGWHALSARRAWSNPQVHRALRVLRACHPAWTVPFSAEHIKPLSSRRVQSRKSWIGYRAL